MTDYSTTTTTTTTTSTPFSTATNSSSSSSSNSSANNNSNNSSNNAGTSSNSTSQSSSTASSSSNGCKFDSVSSQSTANNDLSINGDFTLLNWNETINIIILVVKILDYLDIWSFRFHWNWIEVYEYSNN